jgi:DNA-binding NarL/FixJ family response regulator
MPKITVGIVEDNLLLADTIIEKLALSEDIEVVIRAINGQDLLNQLEYNIIPQVILMDIEMDVMDGITATCKVKSKFPSIKILMLSVYDDDLKLFEAIQAGASGYLLKDEKTSKLINAISEVFEGGASLSPSMATKALDLLRKPIELEQKVNTDIESLSLREKEVLECLTDGKSIKQIAEKLFVSEKTIKKHLEHIYQKLQVNSSREAMAKVMKN